MELLEYFYSKTLDVLQEASLSLAKLTRMKDFAIVQFHRLYEGDKKILSDQILKVLLLLYYN
jgi:hypothetical protein